MRVYIAETLDDLTLDRVCAFCRSSPGYSYLQDPDWPALWPANGKHRYLHAVVIRPEGTIAGYGVLRRRALGGGYALGNFRRGPVTARPDHLGPVLDALLPELRRQGYVAVSANPRWENGDAARVEAALAARGGRLAPPRRQRLHSRTGLVDLSPPPEAIISACDAHARRQLRRIDKLGLSVRPIDSTTDMALFRTWLDAFHTDRSLDRGGLPSLDAQRRWIAAHGGDMAMVEADGQSVGAFTLLRDGPRLLNLSNAWADPRSKLPRSYVVYWHAICRYGGRTTDGGPRWLDHAGLSDPRVDRGDPTADGRDRFKDGFPSQTVDLPRVHQFALRPMLFRAVDALESRVAG